MIVFMEMVVLKSDCFFFAGISRSGKVGVRRRYLLRFRTYYIEIGFGSNTSTSGIPQPERNNKEMMFPLPRQYLQNVL